MWFAIAVKLNDFVNTAQISAHIIDGVLLIQKVDFDPVER